MGIFLALKNSVWRQAAIAWYDIDMVRDHQPSPPQCVSIFPFPAADSEQEEADSA
jgi:hypothetical protein